MSHKKRIFVALAYGLASHLLFLVAVSFMVVGLYSGLRTGQGPFSGPAAWLANAALVIQFPLLHSWLLSPNGRKLLARLAPSELGRDLAPTTFALIASLQVLLTFALWSPSGITLSDAHGAGLWIFRAAFAASWLFLIKALHDAGLELQTGYVGWLSVLRGKRPELPDFPTHGLFRMCRQPVYLGFALTLWTGPVHTLDGLLLALTWTMYCVAGPLHKELRYLGWYGERFSRYRAAVPYILPKLKS